MSAHIAKIHCQLRRQGTWRELGESQTFLVVGLRDPLAALHPIPTHIADQCHRDTKAQSTEFETIAKRFAMPFTIFTSEGSRRSSLNPLALTQPTKSSTLRGANSCVRCCTRVRGTLAVTP